MNLYQGGPMRGYDCYNFNAFELGHAYLTFVLCHNVISPHDLDIEAGDVEVTFEYRSLDLGTAHVPYRHFTDVQWVGEGAAGSEASFAQCMRRDIKVVADCDAVSFLPGWEPSSGCAIEKQVAEWCGRGLFEHSPFSYFREMSEPQTSRSGSILTPDEIGTSDRLGF